MSGKEQDHQGVIGRLSLAGGVIGQIGLLFMVLSISYDVILRYIFVAPTYWALEVNTFLLAFLCVIPAADVLRVGSQIRILFLYDRLTPAVKARLDFLRAAAGIFFCAVMIWKGMDMAWKAWMHNDRMSTSLGTPLFIPYLLLPIGFLLLGLQYAAGLATVKKTSEPPKEDRGVEQQI